MPTLGSDVSNLLAFARVVMKVVASAELVVGVAGRA
jgi:hypothetical protein